MEELLIQAGLSEAEAAAYLFLLEHGTAAPPAVAAGCGLTRTNAYKVLDSLQSVGLVSQAEQHKKIVYTAADPAALATLVAQERNRVIALEQSVKTAMSQLRAKYRRSSGTTSTLAHGHGSQAIVEAYTDQAKRAAPIYFIKSRADVPFMGFETMHKMRYLAAEHGIERFGITPDVAENPITPNADVRTNLTRTLIPADAYTAPVEWTVSGDELRIIKFEGDGEAISVRDPAIADSFREIWQLANRAARPHGAKKSPRDNR